MIKLYPGNVLLKASHRRQMLRYLKRTLRMGQRMARFDLTLSLNRVGRSYEVKASVHDSAGAFACRSRKHDWRDAIREAAGSLATGVHNQLLQPGV